MPPGGKPGKSSGARAKAPVKMMRKIKGTDSRESVSGFSVLWEAIVAVYRSTLSRLERNFTFLSAVCAGCLMHFAGTAE